MWGFDSFEGFPEDWECFYDGYPGNMMTHKTFFGTGGDLIGDVPPNAGLVKGSEPLIDFPVFGVSAARV